MAQSALNIASPYFDASMTELHTPGKEEIALLEVFDRLGLDVVDFGLDPDQDVVVADLDQVVCCCYYDFGLT